MEVFGRCLPAPVRCRDGLNRDTHLGRRARACDCRGLGDQDTDDVDADQQGDRHTGGDRPQQQPPAVLQERRSEERRDGENRPGQRVGESLRRPAGLGRQSHLGPHLVVRLVGEGAGELVEDEVRDHPCQRHTTGEAGDGEGHDLHDSRDQEQPVPPGRVGIADEDDGHEQGDRKEREAEAGGDGLRGAADGDEEVRAELAEGVGAQSPRDVEEEGRHHRDEDRLTEQVAQVGVLRHRRRVAGRARGGFWTWLVIGLGVLGNPQPGPQEPSDDGSHSEMADDDPGAEFAESRQRVAERDGDADTDGPHDLGEGDEPPARPGRHGLRYDRQRGRQVGACGEAGEGQPAEQDDVVMCEGHHRHADRVAEDVRVVDPAAAEQIGEPAADQ
ncbi:hypothetical protein SHXM_09918 [Streptomyces hygroscopicus]|nr:hypothetical protein SHXM_09918 [Streptomyces hygroscopicus]